MAITYPRTDLMTLARPATLSFALDVRQELVEDAGGGQWARDLAPSRWVASYASGDMSHDDALSLEAALNSLDGSIQLFEAQDMRRVYPLAYSDGVFSDSGTIGSVPADRTTLTLSALPASFVISVGDYFQFTYGGIRYLHQVVEAITANGSGVTTAFTIRPSVGLAVDSGAVGTAVKFKNPAMRARLAPGSVQTGAVAKLRSRVSFTAVQAFG